MKASLPTSSELRIVADAAELYQAGAAELARQARRVLETAETFSVALAGGSTPRGVYRRLAGEPYRTDLAWERIHFFWGDERHVPPNDADSNYRMAHEALLSKVAVPATNVHRIMSEHPDADRVARDYESTLREFFRPPAQRWPRFDLVFLGLGADCHTASLFPGTAALHARTRLVVANRVDRLDAERITLTTPLFNSAARVVFLVAGGDKAVAVSAVLEGPLDPACKPAQLIRPEPGTLVWLIDRAAASVLRDCGSF